MKPKLLAGAALSASIVVHAGLLLQRSDDAPRVRSRPPSVIAFSLATPAASPKAPPPPAPQPPAPRPRPKPKPKPNPAIAAPSPRDPEPAADVEPAAELTGTTLMSDVGVGWSAPAGNGEARVGAVGTDNALLASRSAGAPAAPSVPDTPRAVLPPTVSLRELSRKPTPPSLTASLARNYPQRARNMGQSGEASVRALVEASGEVQRAKVTAESSSGFGEACRLSLIGSRWGIPLDRAGRPVATWITYRCKFRVDD